MRLLLHISLVVLSALWCVGQVGCSSHRVSPTPESGALSDARGLTITREGNCYVARVLDIADSSRTLAVYIFPDTDTTRNVPRMDGGVVLTPSALSRLMVYSGVHASALKELGALDAVKIVGDANYFIISEIKQGLQDGSIADGGTQQAPVAEKIMQAKPGAIILSHYDGMDAAGLRRLGIPIIYMCESHENTPLGRAEWIKLLGLIARNNEAADSIFKAVKREYNSLLTKTRRVSHKPKVLTETMYQGVWNVAGGRSYAARMIADAGGQYVWADDDTEGSLSLPFESVLAKGGDADVWLIRSFGREVTHRYLREADARYMLFAPAKALKNSNKGVWGCNTERTQFYEETPFHPDRLLRDYIAIFHPELLPGYTPRYFTKATD